MECIFYTGISIILISAITTFIVKRSLNYLHIFQQHEYDSNRFLMWILHNFAIDKRLTLTLTAFIGFLLLIPKININPKIYWQLKYTVVALILLVFAILEKNPLRIAKKKLILTSRATRIYYVALLLNFVANLHLLLNLNANNQFIILLISIHLIPLYLIISNLVLEPIEYFIQKRILQAAKQKLSNLHPIIIGITGSFGKTSVKHFLGHILQQKDHTLITAGSINTTMGISRTINDQLNPNHKYFVVEMGAYAIGSIEKICQLTAPDFGIITAIGSAHYERFRDLEIVAEAKFELANSVISKSKLNTTVASEKSENNHNYDNINMIIPEKVINTNYAKIYTRTNKSCFKVLEHSNITNVRQLKTGLAWDLNLNGVNCKIETPIFGLHNVTNLSLAIIAAHSVGIPLANIMAAVKTMPQIKHRLEVNKQHNFTIIDDSYNANPDGVRAGLELLSLLHEPPARRILITPGLVELGTKHAEEHFYLGEFAANHVDIAIIINPQRIPSFIAGFKQNTNLVNKELLTVSSFKESQTWINLNCQPNDVVLIANDLPDLYETGLKV